MTRPIKFSLTPTRKRALKVVAHGMVHRSDGVIDTGISGISPELIEMLIRFRLIAEAHGVFVLTPQGVAVLAKAPMRADAPNP